MIMAAARLPRDCRGSTAVEFAMVLPLLVAVVFGVLEFGRAMWMRQSMQFAVEEAARYALANTTASATAISTIASARLATVGPDAGIAVATTLDANAVTVTASADFQTIVPGLLPAGAVTLTARSRLPR